MQEYCGIVYFRMFGKHMDSINIILNEEIANKCPLIKYWIKSNVDGLYRRDIHHEIDERQHAIDLINEYKRIEYLADSDKYLQSVKEFNEII